MTPRNSTLVLLRNAMVNHSVDFRDAFGWPDLDLCHDFHEIETLPANHLYAALEATAAPEKLITNRGRKYKADGSYGNLFA